MVRMLYCGTVGKPDGNGEHKPHPKATGASSLLENRWRERWREHQGPKLSQRNNNG